MQELPLTCSTLAAPPLKHLYYHDRRLLIDCCVFQLNGGHLSPIHLYLSIFLMRFHFAPPKVEPAMAPPNPARYEGT
jgi:hypothetical protein